MKTYRLSALARQFNVGTYTIVEFLAKKGYVVELHPNSKINEEMYALLLDQFIKAKRVVPLNPENDFSDLL